MLNRDILVLTPDIPNCLLLKWIELSELSYLKKKKNYPIMEKTEAILSIFQSKTIQCIDELDLVLAPMKTELNFTVGEAKSIDPGFVRWSYP
jgi:hypothetical protein